MARTSAESETDMAILVTGAAGFIGSTICHTLLAGKRARIKPAPAPPSEPKVTFANVDKAGRLLGYNPQTSVREGLSRFVEWYRRRLERNPMRWLPPLLLMACLTATTGAECPEFTAAHVTGTVSETWMNELSGLAVGIANPEVFWTHNDNLGDNAVHAIAKSGEWVASYILQGAPANDWEDIAIYSGEDGPVIYLADTGNNNLSREFLIIHRFAEPVIPESDSVAEAFVPDYESIFYRYPDGTRYDSETLLVDPITGDIVVVTRDRQGFGFSRMWRIDAATPWDGSIVEPELIGTIFLGGGLWIKGGDVSPDGLHVALIHHTHGTSRTEISLHNRVDGEGFSFSPGSCRIVIHPDTPQSEAVTWSHDGMRLFTTSEGNNQPIYTLDRVPPPPEPPAKSHF